MMYRMLLGDSEPPQDFHTDKLLTCIQNSSVPGRKGETNSGWLRGKGSLPTLCEFHGHAPGALAMQAGVAALLHFGAPGTTEHISKFFLLMFIYF